LAQQQYLWAHQQSYSTLGSVSTGMGDHHWASKPPQCAANHPGQLSLLPSMAWETSPAKVSRCCAAGE